ncbi:MAG TPA: NifB/NifX family molybdenum-iron cluster-binding protein [Bacteroidales bacterium]|jgi:predicted Fe-Mo cluster-binding NifX family protein|nr:NifB/NifX family molybdenum-iron cluster-binding protein [Bacteroidales bacterium]
MKIAFTSTGTTWDSMIDPRFGRTENILLFDEETKELTVVSNDDIKNEAHGAGTATAQKIFDLSPDVLITGNGPGETAEKALKNMKMQICVGANDMTVFQAYDLYKGGKLKVL